MVDDINQFSQICPSLVAVGIVSVYGRIDAGIMPPPVSWHSMRQRECER